MTEQVKSDSRRTIVYRVTDNRRTQLAKLQINTKTATIT